LKDIIVGADFFIGVSVPKTLTKEMVKTMNSKPIIFALSNPIPEVLFFIKIIFKIIFFKKKRSTQMKQWKVELTLVHLKIFYNLNNNFSF